MSEVGFICLKPCINGILRGHRRFERLPAASFEAARMAEATTDEQLRFYVYLQPWNGPTKMVILRTSEVKLRSICCLCLSLCLLGKSIVPYFWTCHVHFAHCWFFSCDGSHNLSWTRLWNTRRKFEMVLTRWQGVLLNTSDRNVF